MRTRTLCCHWSGVGSPGSRATSLCTPGSSTTPGRPGTRVAVPVRIAFRLRNGVDAQGMNLYEAQWLAYALPYRRFAAVLTDCDARLGADRIATPSSYRTCTDCSLPVSRRTAKHSVRHRCPITTLARSSKAITIRAMVKSTFGQPIGHRFGSAPISPGDDVEAAAHKLLKEKSGYSSFYQPISYP